MIFKVCFKFLKDAEIHIEKKKNSFKHPECLSRSVVTWVSGPRLSSRWRTGRPGLVGSRDGLMQSAGGNT